MSTIKEREVIKEYVGLKKEENKDSLKPIRREINILI